MPIIGMPVAVAAPQLATSGYPGELDRHRIPDRAVDAGNGLHRNGGDRGADRSVAGEHRVPDSVPATHEVDDRPPAGASSSWMIDRISSCSSSVSALYALTNDARRTCRMRRDDRATVAHLVVAALVDVGQRHAERNCLYALDRRHSSSGGVCNVSGNDTIREMLVNKTCVVAVYSDRCAGCAARALRYAKSSASTVRAPSSPGDWLAQ